MTRFELRLTLIVAILLAVVMVVGYSSGLTVRADQGGSAANGDEWAYLPAVFGAEQGTAPTATATSAPGSTPTADVTPTVTSTATGTPPPTNTPEPNRLASPTLYNLDGQGSDGDFVVKWSTVPGAEFYRLQQQRNEKNWTNIYEGPLLEKERSGMSAAKYCYRVQAVNPVMDSEWSDVKCITVVNPTSTPTSSSTPGLAMPILYNIDNPDNDGNYTVQWSAVANAQEYILKEGPQAPDDTIIYRGPNTSFERSNLSPGQYCYRVRAIIPDGEWGPFSAPQCTMVVGATSTPKPSPTPTATSVYELPPPTDLGIVVKYAYPGYGDPREPSQRNSGQPYLFVGWVGDGPYDYRLQKSSDGGNNWSFAALKRGPGVFGESFTGIGTWHFQVRAEIAAGANGTSSWIADSKHLFAKQCAPTITDHYYDNGQLRIAWTRSCPYADLQEYRIFTDYPTHSSPYTFVKATGEEMFEEFGYKNAGTWKYRVCAFGYPDGSGFNCADTTVQID